MPEFGLKIIMKVLPSFISSDEELLTVGCFITRAGYLKNQLTLGYAQFRNQTHYVALTDKRLIILPTKRFTGKVDEENVFSVNYANVEVKGNKLIIETQDRKKFLKLSFNFGIMSISGFNKKQFLDVFYQYKPS